MTPATPSSTPAGEDSGRGQPRPRTFVFGGNPASSAELVGRLYDPLRRRGKAAKFILQALAAAEPLRRRRLPLGTSISVRPTEESIVALLGSIAPGAHAYAGWLADGDTRGMLAVRPSRSDEVVFVRIGRDCSARGRHAAERGALSLLAEVDLGSVRIPQILGTGQHGIWEYTEMADVALPCADARVAVPSVLDVSRRLLPAMQATADAVPLRYLVRRLRESASGSTSESTDADAELLAWVGEVGGDSEVRVSLAHGDLAPWNLRLGLEWLCVWDWENVLDVAPWGYDCFYYETQVSQLVRRSDPKDLFDELEATGSKLAQDGIVGPDEASMLLVLYLVTRRLAGGGDRALQEAVTEAGDTARRRFVP